MPAGGNQRTQQRDGRRMAGAAAAPLEGGAAPGSYAAVAGQHPHRQGEALTEALRNFSTYAVF